MATTKTKTKKKSVATVAPTGLSVSRSGGTFTFSWKVGDDDYGAGQWIRYSVNNGSSTGDIQVDSSQTSFEVALGAIASVQFWVKGTRKKYSETKTKTAKKVTTKTTYKYTPTVSAEASTTWSATIPAAPSLSYSRSSSSAGTFSWSLTTSDTDTAIFNNVELQTCAVRTNANPPGSGWSASTKSSSGNVSYTETLSGSNIVRWVRVRSQFSV